MGENELDDTVQEFKHFLEIPSDTRLSNKKETLKEFSSFNKAIKGEGPLQDTFNLQRVIIPGFGTVMLDELHKRLKTNFGTDLTEDYQDLCQFQVAKGLSQNSHFVKDI